jgi:hypothetical protein
MARLALPALLLAAAAAADSAGAPVLAFYAVLVAIPVVAGTALASFGELLDGKARLERHAQGEIWALLLVLLVFGASVRAPAVPEGVVPPAGVSTLFAGLVALALVAALDLAAAVRLERDRAGRVLGQVD